MDRRAIAGRHQFARVPAGTVLGVLGLLAVGAALLPGRRARHTRTTARSAVVIDDRIIASALAQSAADRSGAAPNRVRASVGRHAAIIRVQPTSGIPVDRDDVAAAAAADALDYQLTPTLRTRVIVEQGGVVGA